ncbi:hypothetical protein PAXRUDRAFT_22270 [Paxillus rubicundulus Ve08.2h10]|uniref:Uncharacterized protein n=1 Tax=Paxillus rubicundulus Ve08.2h10 TaxID=930991 RepID=A0A0D0C968_9AGAM|nr:hypothetical protein PAXRUDRAFT_22270 [Paxillus rubicundulus Ve08.2h10]
MSTRELWLLGQSHADDTFGEFDLLHEKRSQAKSLWMTLRNVNEVHSWVDVQQSNQSTASGSVAERSAPKI